MTKPKHALQPAAAFPLRTPVFRQVAGICRRRVRVDVVDIRRRHAGRCESPLDAGAHAGAVGPGVGEVVCITPDGAADELREHGRAARLCVLQGLQHQHACGVRKGKDVSGDWMLRELCQANTAPAHLQGLRVAVLQARLDMGHQRVCPPFLWPMAAERLLGRRALRPDHNFDDVTKVAKSSPAPSPMTKPSRPLSHGRLAASGSPLRFDSALQAMKPPMPEGMIAASAPPASIRSASPRSMCCAALQQDVQTRT